MTNEPKMTEQDRLLKIQMDVKDKTRRVDIISIIALLLIMYGFCIGTLLVPDQEFSEAENRYLQQKPKLSSEGKFLDRVVSGDFMKEIGDYYSDQFPARDLFVGAKAVTEMAMFKMQNNDVVLGKEGYIVKRLDYPDMEIVNKNLTAVNRFSAVMKEENVPFTIAMAGRSVDVLQNYLPSTFPKFHTEQLWDTYEKGITEIDSVNLFVPLKEKADSGEPVYYRTDHHWTTLGAYYGYVEIMKHFGMEPQPLDAFQQEVASDAFYGTTWSSAGMKWIAPDNLLYFRYAGDDTDYVTEIVDTGVTFDGFYDRSYLEKKDKYSSFIGGNNAYEKVYRKDGQKREKLLLIKDSFAHSAAPFLAYHFDLEILDLRYYKNSIKEFVEQNGIDRILLLYNINSMVEANTLGILNIGLNG